MIEVSSSAVIRSSREAVWRHMTRVSDWYRWYPGLHGTSADASITGAGVEWRSTGQMGRMLYRGVEKVTDYRLLNVLEIEGCRRPWLRWMRLRFDLSAKGPHCRLTVSIEAIPSMWVVGRILLSGLVRRRLQAEVDAVTERLRSYVENTMPYH